jgi:hypothetical protein
MSRKIIKKSIAFGCARFILSPVNIINPPALKKDHYSPMSDVDHIAMKKFLDDMAALFVAEEDAWDRTMQYGADVGLDVGPAV